MTDIDVPVSILLNAIPKEFLNDFIKKFDMYESRIAEQNSKISELESKLPKPKRSYKSNRVKKQIKEQDEWYV